MLPLPDGASWVTTHNSAEISMGWRLSRLADWTADWRRFWSRHLDALATELARGSSTRRAAPNTSIPFEAVPSAGLPVGEQLPPAISAGPDESTNQTGGTSDCADEMPDRSAVNSTGIHRSTNQTHAEGDGQ